MNPERDAFGGTVLRIPAIQSPNFVDGVSGWKISIDGSAQFNNLTIRGQFNGNDFMINSAGAFFYSGTPAAGNLLVSIAAAAGSDSFGNSYPAGVKDFGLMSVESSDAHGGLIMIMRVATTLNPATLSIFETAAGNGSIALAVSGDAHARWVARASGQLEWGNGTNAADTFLAREAPGILVLRNSGGVTAGVIPLFAFSTSNETTTLATPVNSAHLSLQVEANAVYEMYAVIFFSISVGTDSYIASWAGPAGATMVWGDTNSTADYISTLAGTDSFSGAGNQIAVLTGLLTVGANAGTFNATFKSSVGGVTASLLANSWLKLTRVA